MQQARSTGCVSEHVYGQFSNLGSLLGYSLYGGTLIQGSYTGALLQRTTHMGISQIRGPPTLPQNTMFLISFPNKLHTL